MWVRLVNFLVLVTSTFALWLFQESYKYPSVQKLFLTFVNFSALYFIFKLVFEGVGLKNISSPKTRYVFRKAVSILFLAVFSVVLVRIWVENPQALFVAYGLVSAGVAVALQDVFKNFAGGITVFFSKPFQVGDRIEVNGKHGDVIDVGLFFTKILEIKEWVDADQPTGRILSFPNGYVLRETVHNYTENNSFLWDEITLPLTYESDWRKAREEIRKIVRDETSKIVDRARGELDEIRRKYLVKSRELEPDVYIKMTDNWIEFHVRFVNDVSGRRVVFNDISERILSSIEEMENVEIASETLDITAFPGNE